MKKRMKNNNVILKVNSGSLSGLRVVFVPSGRITYYFMESPWTKNNVIALLHIAEGERIINNDGKHTYIFEENGKFTFKYLDINNEEREVEAKVDRIDKVGAEIKNVNGNPTEWTKEDGIISVNATDELSGLAKVAYSFDGGNTWQSENEKTYTENTNNIIIKVKDKVGNIAESEPISITKIKKIQKIELKQPANKTEYEEGEDFNSTGMKIEAKYDNGQSEEVSGYEIVNGRNLQKGQTSVRIRYIEKGETKEVEHAIIVVEKKEELSVELREYETIKEEGKNYIENIKANTSIEEIKSNIRTNGTIEIYKGDTKITENNKLLGTGMEIRIKLDNEEIRLTAIVKGDMTGDGKMSISDLLRLSRYAAGIDKNISIEYLKASDVVEGGKYGSISDILKMSRVLANMDSL